MIAQHRSARLALGFSEKQSSDIEGIQAGEICSPKQPEGGRKMGHRLGIVTPSITEEKPQVTVDWRIPVLFVGLSALVLVALVAYLSVSTNAPAATSVDTISRAASPELMVAQRYADAAAARAEALHLTTNPELIVVRRYASTPRTGAGASFLATNPELMTSRRYTAEAAERAKTALLAANPELRVAERFAAGVAGRDSEFLASNPEITAFRRYSRATAGQ
jgi:hypothetical protein